MALRVERAKSELSFDGFFSASREKNVLGSNLLLSSPFTGGTNISKTSCLYRGKVNVRINSIGVMVRQFKKIDQNCQFGIKMSQSTVFVP
jgi:hypothetical protein